MWALRAVMVLGLVWALAGCEEAVPRDDGTPEEAVPRDDGPDLPDPAVRTHLGVPSFPAAPDRPQSSQEPVIQQLLTVAAPVGIS